MRIHCAEWIVPVVSPPIQDGALAIDNEGTIRALGGKKDVLKKYSADIIDHGDAILFPGLVNAHTHLEISHLKNAVPGGDGLVNWIRRFVEKRKTSDDSRIEPAMKRAIEEMLGAGVAVVGDISNTLKSVPHLSESSLKGTIFHEIFDINESDYEKFFLAGVARTELLKISPNLKITLSAHAPCTVSKRLFLKIRDYSETRRLPTCVHLAECEAENEFFKFGRGAFQEWFSSAGDLPGLMHFEPTGDTSTAFLKNIGFLTPRATAIHCVALSKEDIQIIKKSGASVCLCLRSNFYIEGKLPPVKELYEAGISLSLGTDSLASCADLSIFAEMKFLKEHFNIPSAEVLKMATINGARALAVNEDFVSFAVNGKPAIMRLTPDIVVDNAEEYLVREGEGKTIERVA